MSVGDVFTVQVQYDNQGRKFTNNYAYRQTGGPDVPTIAERLAIAFNEDVIPDIQAALSAEVDIQCVYVLRVLPTAGIPHTLALTGISGTIVGASMPNDSPMVFKIQVTAASSKKNGRTYITGIPASAVTNGILNGAYLGGAAQDLATQLEAVIFPAVDVTQTFQPVVINRVALGIPLDPIQHSDVDIVIIRQDIFSQRRRRTRRTLGVA